MTEKTATHDGVQYKMDADADPPTLEIGGKAIAIQRNSDGKYWTPAHPHRVFGSLDELAEALIVMRKSRGL